MNVPLRPPGLPPTTQAAEGLMRRRWSVAEIEAIERAGIIPRDERFELIGGEAVPLAPASPRHDAVVTTLAAFWSGHLPDDVTVAPGLRLTADHDTLFLPDLIFFRRAEDFAEPIIRTTLLVVEVADSSLAFDLRRKAALYAAHEAPEMWVIDADTLDAYIHREPYDGEYEARGHVAPDRPLALPFAPHVAIALNSLTFP